MKTWAVIGLLLASCASTSIADVLMPDELTLGHADSTSAMVGGAVWQQQRNEYDIEGSTTAVALTWHLPSVEKYPMVDRDEILSSSVIIEQAQLEEEATEFSDSMATGATFKADWRHAAVFGSVLLALFIFLLVKLQRSNGWH